MASAAPLLDSRPEGLFAPAFEAFVDPAAPVARAILTHAHADHAVAGHGEVWATPETLSLYRRRHPEWSGIARPLAYGEEAAANGARLRLVPAGHVLGSAQVWIGGEHDESLLYTGDFKLRTGRTCAPAEAPAAATLFMETTFGLPVFVFPPREVLERRILDACREALAAGETPVLLAYALGKSQEVAALLAEAGIPTVLHGAAWKLLPDYAAAGVALPLSRPYESGPPKDGEALITPPSTARTPMVRAIRRRRVIYLSGWALREASRLEFEADVLVPMSDHADFPDLRRHVAAVAPRRVVTLHGFAHDFARILDAQGVPAEALAGREERPPEAEEP
jgi:glyoxylase-like metal-dependent hydrolase (beta-lactamase superfamily II)